MAKIYGLIHVIHGIAFVSVDLQIRKKKKGII